MIRLIFALFLLSSSTLIRAEEIPAKSEIPKVWKISAVALTSASALDLASSWGKCCESNPLLASADRRFGTRGLAIKSGALGGTLLMQYLVARRSPRLAKVLSFVNFGAAGVLTSVAVRNYGVPQPQTSLAGLR